MRIQDFKPRSEFAKQLLSQGRQEGREEGRAEGRAESILRILEVRGLEVTPTQREQITQCADPDLLDRWIERAVTISHTDELFH